MASQVSTIHPELSGRWTKARRLRQRGLLAAACEYLLVDSGPAQLAHALLDLFDSGGFAQALAALGAKRYLLTHIFDGQTSWSPVIDAGLDQEIIAAYHRSMDERHQHGGAGSSRSGQAWLEALPAAGLAIADVAAADWMVRPVGGGYGG